MEFGITGKGASSKPVIALNIKPRFVRSQQTLDDPSSVLHVPFAFFP